MLTSVMQKGILMSKFASEREVQRMIKEFDKVIEGLILVVDRNPNDADLGAEMRILFNKIRKDGKS